MMFSVAVCIAALAMNVAADASKTVLDNAAGDSRFSTLVSLVTKFPDLVNALGAGGPWTVFAPTDIAFRKLAQALPDLFTAALNDDSVLKDVLEYHVLAGTFFSAAHPEDTQLRPIDDKLLISTNLTAVTGLFDDEYLISGAFSIAESSEIIPSSNGEIRVLDQVLIPPLPVSTTLNLTGFSRLLAAIQDVDFQGTLDNVDNVTLFAPTDAAFNDLDKLIAANKITVDSHLISAVLDLHVVKGAFYSGDLASATGPTLSLTTALDGTPITLVYNGGHNATVAGPGNSEPATIFELTSLAGINVVIYVIDRVLLPDLNNLPAGSGPNNIVSPSFSSH